MKVSHSDVLHQAAPVVWGEIGMGTILAPQMWEWGGVNLSVGLQHRSSKSSMKLSVVMMMLRNVVTELQPHLRKSWGIRMQTCSKQLAPVLFLPSLKNHSISWSTSTCTNYSYWSNRVSCVLIRQRKGCFTDIRQQISGHKRWIVKKWNGITMGDNKPQIKECVTVNREIFELKNFCGKNVRVENFS